MRPRVYGFSGIVGLTVGGALADRLYRTRVDGRLIVGMRRDRHLHAAHVSRAGDGRRAICSASRCSMGAGCGVMCAYYSTVYSTIHDVVEPSLRGTAMAL